MSTEALRKFNQIKILYIDPIYLAMTVLFFFSKFLVMRVFSNTIFYKKYEAANQNFSHFTNF